MQNVIERIAHFADIDTRRALGFQPRKLPPSNLVIIPGKKWWYVGRPFTEVQFRTFIRVIATEDGFVKWQFWKGNRPYNYEHQRPS